MCLAFGLTVDIFELITDSLILNKELPAEPSGNGEDVLFSRPQLSSHFWLF